MKAFVLVLVEGVMEPMVEVTVVDTEVTGVGAVEEAMAMTSTAAASSDVVLGRLSCMGKVCISVELGEAIHTSKQNWEFNY